MILMKQTLKTAVEDNGGKLTRLCTGQPISMLHTDDILSTQAVDDAVFKISSYADLQKRAKVSRLFSFCFTLAFFLAMCFEFYHVWLGCLSTGRLHFSLELVLAGLFASGFILYLRSFFNPVIKDFAGHWVNLRTGASNLCGGITIKRKAV